MRPSEQQINDCYGGQLRLANLELNVFVGEVMNNKDLAPAFKTQFDKEHTAWVNKVNSVGCRTNKCLYMKVIYRRNEVGQLLNEIDADKRNEGKDVKGMQW